MSVIFAVLSVVVVTAEEVFVDTDSELGTVSRRLAKLPSLADTAGASLLLLLGPTLCMLLNVLFDFTKVFV